MICSDLPCWEMVPVLKAHGQTLRPTETSGHRASAMASLSRTVTVQVCACLPGCLEEFLSSESETHSAVVGCVGTSLPNKVTGRPALPSPPGLAGSPVDRLCTLSPCCLQAEDGRGGVLRPLPPHLGCRGIPWGSPSVPVVHELHGCSLLSVLLGDASPGSFPRSTASGAGCWGWPGQAMSLGLQGSCGCARTAQP